MGVDPTGNKVKWWQWLIAGVVAVASIALAVVTMGAGLAIAATITGAIVGGAYGAITAAKNGQDILEGFGIGLLAGITLGNISASFSYLAATGVMGTGTALGFNFVASAAVGFGAEVLSQISANNKVTNWSNVLINSVQWGILNSANFGLSYLADINIGNAIVGGYIFNVTTGVIGLVIDLIKSDKLLNRRKIS